MNHSAWAPACSPLLAKGPVFDPSRSTEPGCGARKIPCFDLIHRLSWECACSSIACWLFKVLQWVLCGTALTQIDSAKLLFFLLVCPLCQLTFRRWRTRSSRRIFQKGGFQRRRNRFWGFFWCPWSCYGGFLRKYFSDSASSFVSVLLFKVYRCLSLWFSIFE